MAYRNAQHERAMTAKITQEQLRRRTKRNRIIVMGWWNKLVRDKGLKEEERLEADL